MTNETKGGEPADERAAFLDLAHMYAGVNETPSGDLVWTFAQRDIENLATEVVTKHREAKQRAALQSKACASVGRPMPNVAHEGESGADIEFREGWNACLSALATPPAAPAVTEGASDVLDAFEQDHLGFHLDHNAIQAWINKLRSALAAPAAAVPESPADKKGGAL